MNMPKPDAAIDCRILVPLLIADFVFVLLHIGFTTLPMFSHERFDISQDGGLAEIFQYVKWAAILFFLAKVTGSRNNRWYGVWFLLFLYFLLDDSLQLHERIGGRIARIIPFDAPFGLRKQDIGEVLVFACAGIPLLSAVLIGIRKSTEQFRRVSADLMFFIVLLGICGIIFDVAHFLSFIGPSLHTTFELLDDAGEMVITSFIVGYTFHLKRSHNFPQSTIWRRMVANKPYISTG
jgi:hypothetical protein